MNKEKEGKKKGSIGYAENPPEMGFTEVVSPRWGSSDAYACFVVGLLYFHFILFFDNLVI